MRVIDLLKAYFRTSDRDDTRGIREKLTGNLLTLDRALEPLLAPLFALLDRKRPVSPVLTGRYELCGKPYCGLGRSDIPGQKLVDAIDWMLGDTL